MQMVIKVMLNRNDCRNLEQVRSVCVYVAHTPATCDLRPATCDLEVVGLLLLEATVLLCSMWCVQILYLTSIRDFCTDARMSEISDRC